MSYVDFRPSLLTYFFFPVVGLAIGGLSGAWSFSILAAALFINVVCHELGHYWMAKHAGEKYPHIIVGATGGSTSYSGLLMSNRQLARVVAAGPLMNVLVGVIALFISGHSSLFVQVSFALAFFNLLPIGRLDGAQLLRLLLGRYLDYPEKIMPIISGITAAIFVAYLYFSYTTLTALVGIYAVGYLLVSKR